MKINSLQKNIAKKISNTLVIFSIVKRKKMLLALLLNAFLAGIALSSYIENKLLITKTTYDPIRIDTYDGKIGEKSFSYFRDSEVYNIFVPVKISQRNEKKLPNYLLELHKIKNDLELRGTILLGSTNFAVLYYKKHKKEKPLKEGSNIFTTGVILQKVEKYSALLSFRGHQTSLTIAKNRSSNIIVPVTNEKPISKKKPSKQKQKPSKQVARSTPSTANSNKVLADLTNAIAQEQYLGSFDFNQKNAIKIQNDNVNVKKEYFEGALQNLPVMLSHAKAVPYSKNNEFLGYQLSNVLKDGIFYKLGLRKGDIITKVNGQKIKDLSQVMQFFSVLKNQEYIEVDVLRDSNNFTINYSLI